LRDAVKAIATPVIEVHLSNPRRANPSAAEPVALVARQARSPASGALGYCWHWTRRRGSDRERRTKFKRGE
jgi:3-dehydroquinate dehydratase